MAVDRLIRKASNGSRLVAASLASAKANGATTAELTVATGWNTGAEVDVVLYLTDSSGNEVAGSRTDWVANLSGTSLSDMVLRAGTEPASGYPATSNTVAMCAPTAAWADDLVTALSVEHNPDTGVHKLTQIVDTNGNEVVKFGVTGSAVNEVTLTNAATANAPAISATGGDTNIDLKLTPKGTGRVEVNGAGAAGVSSVDTSQTTASSAFTALATAQSFSVTVGASGRLRVSIGATLSNNGANASYAGFALSGANTLAAADAKSIINVGTNAAAFGRTFVLTGLTPGATTVTMQFRVSSGTGTFSGRELSAEPIG